MITADKIENKLMKIVKGKERTHCELCGAKLTSPETDYRNVAICKKCLKGQYN